VKADCGHVTRLYDKIKSFDSKGKMHRIEMTITTKNPELCHKCFEEKAVIRCALCGGSIFPGDFIILVSIEKDNVPKYAVPYEERFIVCARRACCNNGGLLCGRWTSSGEVTSL
jgi:hypothetical protein